MKYHIDILEEVYLELEEAGIYYHVQSPGLEMKLFDQWEITIERIIKNPESYQLHGKRYRYALLDKFPYLVVFEIIGIKVVVFRFINVRRHPKKRYRKR